MGLGKTVQAIGTAVLKKKIFGFRRALVVCPASLKEQWKKEIERFTGEKAVVVQGTPTNGKSCTGMRAAIFTL
jgi:SNF2 family DNA or RNA helicase